MANLLVDRKEAYRKKIEKKRARISSSKIGISPDTKRLEELEENMIKELKKIKISVGKERE